MNKLPLWKYLSYGGITVICGFVIFMIVTSGKSEETKVLPVSNLPIELISQERVKYGLRKGDKVIMKHDASLFPNQLTVETSLDAFHVEYYGKKGETFQVQAIGKEMISAKTYERGTLWIPIWYTSEEASHIEYIEPTYMTFNSHAKLAFSPVSTLKWDIDGTDQRQWVAIKKWKDWYGVIVSPTTWRVEYQIYKPTLLWVHASDIEKQEIMKGGILDKDSKVPIEVARSMIVMMLREEMDQSIVRQLLGEPHIKELSDNLQMTVGDPLTLGMKWRYEFPNAQYTVSFSNKGKLKRSEWILPTLDKTKVIVSSGNDYQFNYRFINTPIASTMKWKPMWRNQGDIDFTYLIGANEEVLLIKGDDGGFSGMHMVSSIYALNRETGKKVWQINAGYGVIHAEVNREATHVTIFSEYNPEKKSYEARIRHIRLADGKVEWEMNPAIESSGIDMKAARDSILLYDRQDLNSTQRTLTVLNSQTGKVKWTRKLEGKYEIRNKGSQDPFVLIDNDRNLQALDVNTGKIRWVQKITG